MEGYRIADFEQALPEGAVIDEVVYQSKAGQRVKYAHGQVQDVTTIRVTWDDAGKCYKRTNWIRLTKWDLDLAGSKHEEE